MSGPRPRPLGGPADEWDEFDPDVYDSGGHDTAARLRVDRASFDSDEYDPPEDPSAHRTFVEWIVFLAGVAGITALFLIFVAQAFKIPSESMTPTLQVGDRVMVNKLADTFGTVERGDVVVFDRPPNLVDSEATHLIKRVIAFPGETVEGRGGILYVNDRPLQEPYLPPFTTTLTLPRDTVPEGTLWVMGDNRTGSADSREFGPVSTDLLVGEALFIFWPPGNIGAL